MDRSTGTKASASANASIEAIRRQVAANALDEAERSLWTILSQDHDNSGALELLGNIRMRQQRLPEAESLLRRCVTVNPDSSSCDQELGQVLILQGRYGEAIAAFVAAEKLNPAEVSTKVDLARAYTKQGLSADAVAILIQIPKARLPASAVPVLARCLIATGRTADAIALIPRVLGASVQADAIALAEVFTDASLPKEAAHSLSTVLRQPKVPLRAWYLLGVSSEQRHDYGSARRAYQRALAQDANSTEVLVALGGLSLKEGKVTEACDMLQRAGAIEPKSVAIQRELILAALKARRPDVVRSAAEALFRLSVENPEDLYLAGTGFLSVGSFQAAERAFTDYLVQKPNDPRGEFAIGSAYRNLQNYPAAQQHLERSIALDPSGADAPYQLAQVLVSLNNPDAARTLLSKTVAGHPDHAPALASLGVLTMRAGKDAEAVVLLERSSKLDPGNAETHYQLSLAYKRLGKLEQSKNEAQIFRKLRAGERQ